MRARFRRPRRDSAPSIGLKGAVPSADRQAFPDCPAPADHACSAAAAASGRRPCDTSQADCRARAGRATARRARRSPGRGSSSPPAPACARPRCVEQGRAQRRRGGGRAPAEPPGLSARARWRAGDGCAPAARQARCAITSRRAHCAPCARARRRPDRRRAPSSSSSSSQRPPRGRTEAAKLGATAERDRRSAGPASRIFSASFSSTSFGSLRRAPRRRRISARPGLLEVARDEPEPGALIPFARCQRARSAAPPSRGRR